MLDAPFTDGHPASVNINGKLNFLHTSSILFNSLEIVPTG